MLITILTILCGLFAVASIVLFLLWQRSEHRWNKHYCDEDCHEYGCSEDDGFYIPDGVYQPLPDAVRSSVLESMAELMERETPLANAMIKNLTITANPAGLKIPFGVKKR